jgi:hypothetical protein
MLGKEVSMDYIHHLGYAKNGMQRVLDYLQQQEMRSTDAVRNQNLAAARMLVTFARNAVSFEHALLERVHVYKLTGR